MPETLEEARRRSAINWEHGPGMHSRARNLMRQSLTAVENLFSFQPDQNYFEFGGDIFVRDAQKKQLRLRFGNEAGWNMVYEVAGTKEIVIKEPIGNNDFSITENDLTEIARRQVNFLNFFFDTERLAAFLVEDRHFMDFSAEYIQPAPEKAPGIVDVRHLLAKQALNMHPERIKPDWLAEVVIARLLVQTAAEENGRG